jgi:hypothetical protein
MASYVKIEEIKEGMVLAEDIKNRQGYLMLAKGVELGERHKKIFTTWSIPGVLVEGLEDLVEISPEELSAAKAILEALMDFECSLPIEIDLFNAAVINIANNEHSRTEQG